MSTFLIKNIETVVTCDDSDRVLHGVSVLIRDGFIESILEPGEPLPRTDETMDASRMIMYPGLINTHHHLYQYFSRNLPAVQNMELFDWLRALYEIWKNLDGELVRLSSLSGMGELLKSGCTTCFDHHYVFPEKADHRLIDAQFMAASELGIRMHASRGSMSLSKKDGGLPPDSVVESVDAILRDSERLIDEYHDCSRGSMRMVALAPCSPFSVTRELLRDCALLAREKGVRLHTHLCETKDEERFTLEKCGMRPFEYMQSVGWTGSDVWYAHGIHFNDDELLELVRTKTGVAHCPVSNMKLSSGVARIGEMLSLGIPVGLGVDGSASNDGSNMLEEIRVCYLLHRLIYGDKAPSGYDVLKIATRGGARILGRSDIGHIAESMCADIFMVDSRRLELIGAALDPKSMLATVGLTGCVDCTVVNGKRVVMNGRLVNVDEELLAKNSARKIIGYLA